MTLAPIDAVAQLGAALVATTIVGLGMAAGGDGDRDGFPAAAHLSEAVRGNKHIDLDAGPHAGRVDDDLVRELLTKLVAHFDPEQWDRDAPADVTETRLWQQLMAHAETETATRALRDGDLDTISNLVGDPAMESDISGLKAIQKVEQIMDKEAPIVYVYGEPGSGKSNISLLLAQVWSRIQQRHDRPHQLASNIRTLRDQDEWIERYSELEAWAKEHVVPVGSERAPDLDDGLGADQGGMTLAEGAPRKLYIFDEASSHAVGSGEKGFKTGQLLGPLVKTIRKGNCGLIIIGHDGKDVHPAVRVLAKVCRRYVENQKRATFYHSIQERSPVRKIVDTTGVPMTDYQYDDKEDTRFVWDVDAAGDGDDDADLLDPEDVKGVISDHDRKIAAEMYLDNDIDANQSEVASVFGKDQSWVSRQVKKYKKGELSQDGDGMGIDA